MSLKLSGSGPGYKDCPSLCIVMLSGMVYRGLRRILWPVISSCVTQLQIEVLNFPRPTSIYSDQVKLL